MESTSLEREMAAVQEDLQKARELIASAEVRQAEGDSARQEKRWRDAIASFESARDDYMRIQSLIRAHAQASGPTPLAALRRLREEAGQIEQRAAQGLREAQELTASCQDQVREAAQKLRSAQSARDERHCGDARDYAREAAELDPALRAETERLLRSLDEICAKPSIGGWVAAIIVVVLIGVVILLFGREIWQRVHELFYPPASAGLPRVPMVIAVLSSVSW